MGERLPAIFNFGHSSLRRRAPDARIPEFTFDIENPPAAEELQFPTPFEDPVVAVAIEVDGETISIEIDNFPPMEEDVEDRIEEAKDVPTAIVVEEEKEEEDTSEACPICLHTINDGAELRIPPCGHIICTRCLFNPSLMPRCRTWECRDVDVCVAHPRPSKCPGCRNSYLDDRDNTRNWMNQYPSVPNLKEVPCDVCSVDSPLLVDNEASSSSSSSSSSEMQVVPEPVTVSTHFCVECRQNLCTQCQVAHKKISQTKNHKIVCKTDTELYTKCLQLVGMEVKPCVVHPENLADLYCNTSFCFCCIACIEGPLHKQNIDHLCDVYTIEQKAERLLEDLEEKMKHVDDRIAKLGESTYIIDSIPTVKAAMVSQFTTMCEVLFTQLRLKVHELEQEVTNVLLPKYVDEALKPYGVNPKQQIKLLERGLSLVRQNLHQETPIRTFFSCVFHQKAVISLPQDDKGGVLVTFPKIVFKPDEMGFPESVIVNTRQIYDGACKFVVLDADDDKKIARLGMLTEHAVPQLDFLTALIVFKDYTSVILPIVNNKGNIESPPFATPLINGSSTNSIAMITLCISGAQFKVTKFV